jgi:general secretion pathway protein A
MKTLMTAAREVSGGGERQRRKQKLYQWILAGLILVLCMIFGATYYEQVLQVFKPLPQRTSEPVVQKPVAKPKVEIVRPATLERPIDQTGFSTKEMAYDTLFGEWRIHYVKEKGRSACEQALALGLRCLEGKGSVGILRQMNKPAVLRLVDDRNDDYYATLTSLKGETATCVIGNAEKTVDLKELVRWWSGDYLIVWRAPAEYEEELKPGGSGRLVEWLERHPELSKGQKPARMGLRNKYEGELVKQVTKFQLAAGMVPDGIVGPRTMMLLNTAFNSTDPGLDGRKGSN